MECLACKSIHLKVLPTKEAGDRYFHCADCDFRFLNPIYRLNSEDEKKRYQLHTQEPSDPGYQEFVKPLLDEIKKGVGKDSSLLDFGSGPAAMTAGYLRGQGYSVDLYDPFFSPSTKVFDQKYDLVYACEVVEHFFDPSFEFSRISSMLKPGGIFAIMTSLYDSGIDFDQWYYRKDPTHISLYSMATFEKLALKHGFDKVDLRRKNIIFLWRSR